MYSKFFYFVILLLSSFYKMQGNQDQEVRDVEQTSISQYNTVQYSKDCSAVRHLVPLLRIKLIYVLLRIRQHRLAWIIMPG